MALLVISEAFDDSDNDDNEGFALPNVEGKLLVANDDKFNSTNPDIRLAVNSSEDVVVFNKDSDQHDFTSDALNVKSKILNEGENFKTTIVTNRSGTYEYYCSLHPEEMRGKIIVGA